MRLRRLIDTERGKFGAAGRGPAGESYAQLMAEYEKLAVDREFAEGAYRGARIARRGGDGRSAAQIALSGRHIEPGRAKLDRTGPALAAGNGGGDAAGRLVDPVLIYYSVRDRR